MIPKLLVHGGGFDSRCWEPLLPFLNGPVAAVDLPGRGRRPPSPEPVTFEAFARAIEDEVTAAGFEDVVLVGHSQAGCSLPGAMALLGGRVRHAVFVAALVPRHGESPKQALAPAVEAMVDKALEDHRSTMGPDEAKRFFGNDLDDGQFDWCMARLVPEPPNLLDEPVDLSGLKSTMPRSWIRTTRDAILSPLLQLEFARRVDAGRVVDLDAGHMCMISQPAALAAAIEDLSGATG